MFQCFGAAQEEKLRPRRSVFCDKTSVPCPVRPKPNPGTFALVQGSGDLATDDVVNA